LIKLSHKCRALQQSFWLFVLVLVWGSDIYAQVNATSTYPNHPVKIIVGFQPGAATDTIGRIIGQQLSQRLHQQFVIENKPGAATRIAMEMLSKAAPDGYTLAIANAVTTTFPMMFTGMSFDPDKDFTPVAMLGRTPSFLVIRSSLPVRNYAEFVLYAKGHKLSFGHPGNGTNPHIASLALVNSLAVDAIDVSYKGNQPVATALAAGEIDFALLELESARPLLERKAIKILAITEPSAFPLQPDIPLGRDVGITMEIESLTPWYILLAPPGTADQIIQILTQEIRDILNMPDVRDKLLSMGFEPESTNQTEAANYFLAHRQKILSLLPKLGISIKN